MVHQAPGDMPDVCDVRYQAHQAAGREPRQLVAPLSRQAQDNRPQHGRLRLVLRRVKRGGHAAHPSHVEECHADVALVQRADVAHQPPQQTVRGVHRLREHARVAAQYESHFAGGYASHVGMRPVRVVSCGGAEPLPLGAPNSPEPPVGDRRCQQLRR
ncbi:fatty acid-CoA ligase [Babesia caballi]|uniref:Fatty acid-CoA ligase n=1 Tax=Babesia caballi TaxID=5871 RepID=A0AAV4LM48_BABCB|nr:fatty acid-CoA ligase [Babesia caballi]